MTPEEFIAEYNDDRPYITARTSGSTGKPKVIHLEKEFVKESARRTNRFFGINSSSILYSCVSPEYIGGKMMLVRAIEADCQCICETPSNRPQLHAEKISLLAVVPSQMWHILNNLEDLPIIDHIIIGGQQIPPQLASEIAQSGLDAWETYGMTETASHIAMRKVDGKQTYFQTLEGININLSSNDCLCIKIGEKTFFTNDIAEIIDDYRFRILGRADNVIITGGKKLIPEQIEEKISTIIGRRCLIGSRPDTLWGNAVVLTVEGETPLDNATLANIKIGLEPWQFPKEIRYIHQLHTTPNGKLIRNC